MEKNVLIVDDDEVMLRLIRYTLEEFVTGNITTFESSVDALNFVNSNKISDIDLVICDWQMPENDGLEILDAVRTKDPQIPFLMVTAIPTLDIVNQAKNKGASDFLCKPLRNHELMDKVQRLLNT